MYRGLKVCIIIPVFNEEDMIGYVLRTLPRPLVDAVVIIDDGSTDSSYNIAKTYQSWFPQFLLRKHEKNMGFGAALKSCYITSLETKADVIVLIGGDGTIDPQDLPSLLDPIVDGYADIVSGDRFAFGGAKERMPRDRLVLNRLVTAVAAAITGYGIADAECGYSAMTGRSVASLDWADMSDGWGIALERLLQLRKRGFLLANAPVRTIYRRKRSHLRYFTYVRDYASVALALMPLWIQFAFKHKRIR